VLAEDLLRAYHQLRGGRPVAFPPRGATFRQWAERLAQDARSEVLARELAYWLDPRRQEVGRLPVDYPDGANTAGSAAAVTVTLGADETRALTGEVPQASGAEVAEVLLAALAQAYQGWTGQDRLLVDVESDGRTAPDVARAVGAGVTGFPLLLSLGGPAPGDALRTVKAEVRGVPGRGIGFPLLRYLAGDDGVRERLRRMPAAEVGFGYRAPADARARAGTRVRPAEPVGRAQSPRAPRRHLIELTASIRDGALQLRWGYSAAVHGRATVERLAERFTDALRALLAYGRAPQAPTYTAADFPAANLSQEELDALLARIGGTEQGQGTAGLRPLGES
jgi:non-ribosomal peptide synthase protein (TIGR01720 family)